MLMDENDLFWAFVLDHLLDLYCFWHSSYTFLPQYMRGSLKSLPVIFFFLAFLLFKGSRLKAVLVLVPQLL